MNADNRNYGPSTLASKAFGVLLFLGGFIFFAPLASSAMRGTLNPGTENVVYFVFLPMTGVFLMLGLLVMGYSDGTKINRKKGYVQTGFRIFAWAKEDSFPLEQFHEICVNEETHSVQNANGSRHSRTDFVVRLTGSETGPKPSVGSFGNRESATERADEVAEFLSVPVRSKF